MIKFHSQGMVLIVDLINTHQCWNMGLTICQHGEEADDTLIYWYNDTLIHWFGHMRVA